MTEKYCENCCNYITDYVRFGGNAYCIITHTRTHTLPYANLEILSCPFFNVEKDRIHIAPCTDGTIIYSITCDDFEEEFFIKEGIYLYGLTEYENGELNKEFWLTREDAEKSLKKKKALEERNR